MLDCRVGTRSEATRVRTAREDPPISSQSHEMPPSSRQHRVVHSSSAAREGWSIASAFSGCGDIEYGACTGPIEGTLPDPLWGIIIARTVELQVLEN